MEKSSAEPGITSVMSRRGIHSPPAAIVTGPDATESTPPAAARRISIVRISPAASFLSPTGMRSEKSSAFHSRLSCSDAQGADERENASSRPFASLTRICRQMLPPSHGFSDFAAGRENSLSPRKTDPPQNTDVGSSRLIASAEPSQSRRASKRHLSTAFPSSKVWRATTPTTGPSLSQSSDAYEPSAPGFHPPFDLQAPHDLS